MGLPRYPSILDYVAPPRPQGIAFYQRVAGLVHFDEPRELNGALPPPSSGLYAILVQDESCSPRKFRVLYFGQARNASARVGSSHERYGDWARAGNGAWNLFVAFHWMPGSTEQQRCAVEDELIAYYDPVCNKTLNRSNPLLAALYGMPAPPKRFGF
ncbi:MAG TPA: hypothetical protein VOA41_11685 [Candidatus Dormibacteraeota bacterium]|nr:hypothetical protein [Candidatus Dormibacteraeota bacterium]